MNYDPRPLQLFYFVLSAIVLITHFSFFPLAIGGIVYVFLVSIGVNFGLHRGLTHGIVASDSSLFKIGVLVGSLTNLGSPLNWATVHRLHHKYSDTLLDPHSPGQIGRWDVFFNQWKLPTEISAREKIAVTRDFLKNPVVRFCHRNYSLIHFSLATLIIISFGWVNAAYFYFLPCTLCLLGTSMVNTFCHGSNGTSDNSLINFLTMGEGLHKTHHQKPRTIDYSAGWNFDFTGKVLSFLITRPHVSRGQNELL